MPPVRPRTVFSLALIIFFRSKSTSLTARAARVREHGTPSYLTHTRRRRRTNDAVLLEVVLGVLVHVRRVQQRLGRNAANVQAGAAQSPALLNAGHLRVPRTRWPSPHVCK